MSLDQSIPWNQLRNAFYMYDDTVQQCIDSLALGATDDEILTKILLRKFVGDHALLQAAAAAGQLELAKYLMRRADEVSIKQQVLALADKEGDNALNCAAQNGNDEIVSLLLEHGADANYQNKMGHTALFKAVSCDGTVATVQTLINNGADLTLTCKEGYTVMHWTVDRNTHLA